MTVDRAEVTVEALRAAAATLDTEGTRARAAGPADELRTAGGASRAADLIEAEARVRESGRRARRGRGAAG